MIAFHLISWQSIIVFYSQRGNGGLTRHESRPWTMKLAAPGEKHSGLYSGARHWIFISRRLQYWYQTGYPAELLPLDMLSIFPARITASKQQDDINTRLYDLHVPLYEKRHKADAKVFVLSHPKRISTVFTCMLKGSGIIFGNWASLSFASLLGWEYSPQKGVCGLVYAWFKKLYVADLP